MIGCLLCYLAARLTSRNRQLLANQSVPDRYVQQLRARLEGEPAIRAVPELEAVYLGPSEVLVTAAVEMSDGLTGGEVAASLPADPRRPGTRRPGHRPRLSDARRAVRRVAAARRVAGHDAHTHLRLR